MDSASLRTQTPADRIRNICRRMGLAALAFLAAVALCVAYAFLIEPRWLAVRHLTITPVPRVRLVHVSDLHYKGDRRFLEKVVAAINRIDAQAVCFTGDLVEDSQHLQAWLQILGGIEAPMFGVPGNHDLWARLIPIIPPFHNFRRRGRVLGLSRCASPCQDAGL